jgi:hypothetical protein
MAVAIEHSKECPSLHGQKKRELGMVDLLVGLDKIKHSRGPGIRNAHTQA